MTDNNTIQRPGFALHLVHGGEVAFGELPEGSLALDGCVRGLLLDVDQRRVSLDHHADCVRFATAATCEQVRRYRLFGGPAPSHVWVNDLDGDTLLSLWLLEAPLEELRSDTVRRLVRGVGAVDAHGPAGYLELSEEEEALTRLFFSPAGIFPATPRDVQQRFAEWLELIETGLQAISAIVGGDVEPRPQAPAPDVRIVESVVTRHGASAVLLESPDGFGAIGEAYNAGYDVVVVGDGEGMVTLAKRSDLVPFSLGGEKTPGSALWRLSNREAGWGGGSSIGGSPRPDGTRLTLDEVWEAVTSEEGL